MKLHTTNYFDTFIEIADDSAADCGTVPPSKEKKTVAEMQYELIAKNPYKYTSDDVLFMVYAERNDLKKAEYKQAREQFFSKGQACFRASPLTKKYGFGVHFELRETAEIRVLAILHQIFDYSGGSRHAAAAQTDEAREIRHEELRLLPPRLARLASQSSLLLGVSGLGQLLQRHLLHADSRRPVLRRRHRRLRGELFQAQAQLADSL